MLSLERITSISQWVFYHFDYFNLAFRDKNKEIHAILSVIYDFTPTIDIEFGNGKVGATYICEADENPEEVRDLIKDILERKLPFCTVHRDTDQMFMEKIEREVMLN